MKQNTRQRRGEKISLPYTFHMFFGEDPTEERDLLTVTIDRTFTLRIYSKFYHTRLNVLSLFYNCPFVYEIYSELLEHGFTAYESGNSVKVFQNTLGKVKIK